MQLTIRELKGRPEIEAIWPFISTLNPKMDKARFDSVLTDLLRFGYRCCAAYDDSGACVGICGFWISARFYSGRIIQPDNLCIDESRRGAGIGKAIMGWLEAKGREEGCELAVLDTYTHNSGSHKFYFREGYTILGYHFVKKL